MAGNVVVKAEVSLPAVVAKEWQLSASEFVANFMRAGGSVTNTNRIGASLNARPGFVVNFERGSHSRGRDI